MATFLKRTAHSVDRIFSLCFGCFGCLRFCFFVFFVSVLRPDFRFWLLQFLAIPYLLFSIRHLIEFDSGHAVMFCATIEVMRAY